MNKHTEAIWKLLHPYIASEDPPDSGDSEKDLLYLMESVLPNVWGHVAKLEKPLNRIENIAGGLDEP